MTPKKKILQIMPADGWSARFRVEEPGMDVEDYFDDLTCWALIEADGQTCVEGMVAQGGIVDFCEDVVNFVDYWSPAEKEIRRVNKAEVCG